MGVPKCQRCSKNAWRNSDGTQHDVLCTEHRREKIEGDNPSKKLCNEYKRGCWILLDKDFKYGKCDACREKIANDKVKRNVKKIKAGILKKADTCLKCDKRPWKARDGLQQDVHCCEHRKERMELENPDKKICIQYVRGCWALLDKDSKYAKCQKCLKDASDAVKLREQKKGMDKRNTKCLKCDKNAWRNADGTQYDNVCTEHRRERIEGDNPDKKLCRQYVRGCWTLLDKDSSNTNCRLCRQKAQVKDNKRKEIKKLIVVEEEKYCTGCEKHKVKDLFVGDRGQETEQCQDCRNRQKEMDAKRPERSRGYKATESTKLKKKIWREKHPEKVAEYSLVGRAKKINKDGIDEFHKREAEQARRWREKNPEKMAISNQIRNESSKVKFGWYQNRAFIKGIHWMLTYEEFEKFILDPCFYCGQKDSVLNGIDRKNNKGHYTMNNSVSCCTMCNMIKGEKDYCNFMGCMMHIVSNLMICEFGDYEYYPECFNDWLGSSLSRYAIRAKNKNLDFEIKKYFDEITNMNCYICNKETNNRHRNGIDRINNKLGYTLDNCAPCCADCNYMKRDYDIDDFIYRLYLIYCNFKKIAPKDKHYISLLADVKRYYDKVRIRLGVTIEEIINKKYGEYENNKQIYDKKTNNDMDETENIIEKYKKRNKISELTTEERARRRQYEREQKRKQRKRNKIYVAKVTNDTYGKKKSEFTIDEKRDYDREMKRRQMSNKKSNDEIVENEHKKINDYTIEERRQYDRDRKRHQRSIKKGNKKIVENEHKTISNYTIEERRQYERDRKKEQREKNKYNIEEEPRKLTKEELNVIRANKKEEGNNKMVDKYNDEKYIKFHSLELALQQAISKNNIELIEKYKKMINEIN